MVYTAASNMSRTVVEAILYVNVAELLHVMG